MKDTSGHEPPVDSNVCNASGSEITGGNEVAAGGNEAAAVGEEGEEEDSPEKRVALLPPIRKPTGMQKSAVWDCVKLLADQDTRRDTENNATHECIFCKELIVSTFVETRKNAKNGCHVTAQGSSHSVM